MNYRSLTIISAICLPTTVAFATVFDVPTKTYPTIQSAVNAAVDGDEIIIHPGTYTSTADPADPIIDLSNKALWLRGSGGPDVTIIDGEGLRQAIDCSSNNNTFVTTIEGLTITNCYNEGDGGGISSYGRNLTITNCKLTNNEVLSNGGISGQGGGIYTSNGDIVNISDCTFDGNTSSGYSGGDGGGLAILYSDEVNITNTTFNNNSTDGNYSSGAGLYCYTYDTFLDLTVTNCDFTNNTTNNDYAGSGGGAYIVIAYGPITFMDCNFVNNSSPEGSGGGLSMAGGDGLYTRQLTNCTFTNNSAKSDGGGMYTGSSVDDVLNYALNNCHFDGNSVTGNGEGGGIYMWNGAFTNCTFTNNSATRGGGAESRSSSFDGCTFDGNTSQNDAGGLWCGYNDGYNISGCTFSNNHTTGSSSKGGGMYCGDDPIITDCIFSNNTANESGGGMYCGNDGNPTLNNCSFLNNSCNFIGGGMYTGSTLGVILTNCDFDWNTAALRGGGMYCIGDYTTLTDCSFTNNDADWGGGMYCSNDPTINRCTFKNNVATNDGGGMFCNNSSNPVLSDSTICGNTPNQISGSWTDNGGNTIADVCPSDCPDLDGDGVVSVTDLLIIIGDWGLANSPADINGDGIVDVSDLLTAVGAWGVCP
jgi:predicted outer membrane repeat protein